MSASSVPSQSAPAPTFGATTTGEEITRAFPDAAKGKTIFITGAGGGLGFETARVLALAGASVIVATRSQAGSDEAVERLRKLAPGAQLTPFVVDLADQAQIKAAAAAYIATGRPLHILINNAGIMACPRSFTKDGFESQFGVNHLGHFTLTNGLLPALLATTPARIVNLSSSASYAFAPRVGIEFNDLKGEVRYHDWERYGSSKLANVLHAQELQRRYGSRGITAVSLHPGGIMTKLSRHVGVGGYCRLVSSLLFGSGGAMEAMKTVPQGVSTTLTCALAPNVVPGAFYRNCVQETEKIKSIPHYGDSAMASQLWAVSEELTGSSAPA